MKEFKAIVCTWSQSVQGNLRGDREVNVVAKDEEQARNRLLACGVEVKSIRETERELHKTCLEKHVQFSSNYGNGMNVRKLPLRK